MVSLDSSFLIDLLAGRDAAVVRARELDASGDPRYISAPAASEVLLGAYRLGGRYLERTRGLVDGIPMLPFDREAAHLAGRVGAELLSRGIAVGQADLFVAAISMRHSQSLLTKDRAFHRIPGLVVQSY